MSKKLEAKNALIELPTSPKQSHNQVNAEANQPVQSRPRTAVGGMAQFVTTQSSIHQEAAELREKLKEFDDAGIVRALDPCSIANSLWANRHEDTFHTDEFAALKNEIKDSGGNIQPIKVRVLNRSTPTEEQGIKYEIVFGHRRHRACKELGIAVNSLIEAVTDQQLFEQMERENRGRKNLSAWEQGCMYLAALDKGLYASQRKLAESIGVDISLVSKSIALARLPKAIIDAFPSPLDIQFRWAQPLGEILQKDPDGVVTRAIDLKRSANMRPLSAAEIFVRLTSIVVEKASVTQTSELRKDGVKVGKLSVDQKGKIVVTLGPDSMSATRHTDFIKAIEDFLKVRS